VLRAGGQRTNAPAPDAQLVCNGLELDGRANVARRKELQEVIAQQPERLVLAAPPRALLRVLVRLQLRRARSHQRRDGPLAVGLR